MSEQTVYEYASIRVVPCVEREEFLNVGVILYCKKQRFVGVRFTVDKPRLLALYPAMDLTLIENHLLSFKNICLGLKEGGRLAELPLDERFRWLTAKRSTIIQCSAVHPGLCISAEDTLQTLFSKLVTQ